jgi:hypothetical protein
MGCPQKLDSVGMGLGSVWTSLLLNRATFRRAQRIALKHVTSAGHRDCCFESQTVVGLQTDSFSTRMFGA